MSDIKSLLTKIKNKYMEILVVDDYEDLVLSDFTQKVNSAIFGKVVDLIGDFLVVECLYFTADGELKTGNIIYLNTWNIKAMTELNDKGSMNDVLLGVNHARKIKKLLGITK